MTHNVDFATLCRSRVVLWNVLCGTEQHQSRQLASQPTTEQFSIINIISYRTAYRYSPCPILGYIFISAQASYKFQHDVNKIEIFIYILYIYNNIYVYNI